jgi:hypothetical protein
MGVSATLFAGCVTRGRIFIRERPVEPVYSRPAAPYPGAVWIPGEWEWRGGRYVYINGYYVHGGNRVWIPGHWREVPGGYVWDKGHWG